MKRVVITGLGPVTSIGIGKEMFWDSLLAGRSGISNITAFDPKEYKTKIAGEIKNFDFKTYFNQFKNNTDRFTQFGLVASQLAIKDSGLNIEAVDTNRMGVYMGSGIGGMLFYEKQVAILYEEGPNKVHPSAVAKITPNALSGNIAITWKIKGPNITICTACSSSCHSIGLGFQDVRSGKINYAIVGGAEASILPVNFASFDNMRVLSRNNSNPQKASRPFDKNRDGFIMGEGGAALIIEELQYALKRKAEIYAEIVGYGSSSGAYHMVIPLMNGEDAKAAMFNAIEDARINIDNIVYIHAHGTSTIANDVSETNAIKSLFKNNAYKISVTSNKSMLGHLIGASGAVSVLTTALSIKNGIVTPTINYETKDLQCDLDYTPNVPKKRKLDVGLINSFGFGSNNACVVLKKFVK